MSIPLSCVHATSFPGSPTHEQKSDEKLGDGLGRRAMLPGHGISRSFCTKCMQVGLSELLSLLLQLDLFKNLLTDYNRLITAIELFFVRPATANCKACDSHILLGCTSNGQVASFPGRVLYLHGLGTRLMAKLLGHGPKCASPYSYTTEMSMLLHFAYISNKCCTQKFA